MDHNINVDEIYNNLVQELGLESLSEDERNEVLVPLAEAIQKQFFLDCHDRLGSDMFEALEASVKMGADFYGTTLKHLIPDYEEVFAASRKKVIDAYKNANTSEQTTVVQ